MQIFGIRVTFKVIGLGVLLSKLIGR